VARFASPWEYLFPRKARSSSQRSAWWEGTGPKRRQRLLIGERTKKVQARLTETKVSPSISPPTQEPAGSLGP
jgi:hypothetical protein